MNPDPSAPWLLLQCTREKSSAYCEFLHCWGLEGRYHLTNSTGPKLENVVLVSASLCMKSHGLPEPHSSHQYVQNCQDTSQHHAHLRDRERTWKPECTGFCKSAESTVNRSCQLQYFRVGGCQSIKFQNHAFTVVHWFEIGSCYIA